MPSHGFSKSISDVLFMSVCGPLLLIAFCSRTNGFSSSDQLQGKTFLSTSDAVVVNEDLHEQ